MIRHGDRGFVYQCAECLFTLGLEYCAAKVEVESKKRSFYRRYFSTLGWYLFDAPAFSVFSYAKLVFFDGPVSSS